MCVIANVVMVSCTNDEPTTTQNKIAVARNTQLTDGQGDPNPIKPPKP